MKFEGHKKWNGRMVIYTIQNPQNIEVRACQQAPDGLCCEGVGTTPQKAYDDWKRRTIAMANKLYGKS